ncbi:MAG: hypothetical protein EOO51_02190 [Flavobacterium sp.]|nr:MAG: hypothetical protein EOO51_02190 [Flavobacterium sp.]
MKKLILLVIVLIAPIQIGFSQTAASLKNDLQKFYTSFNDIDLEAIAESLCSNSAQKELYDQLDQYFLNDNSKFRYVFTNVKYNIGPLTNKNGEQVTLVNFRNVIRVTYFKPIEVAKMQAELKQRYGAQTITYEKKRNAFLIVYNARLMAITSGKTWKFKFLDNTLPDGINSTCRFE